MYYFPETAPKTWSIVEALSVYDKKYPNYSFWDVLDILKLDLIQFQTAQRSLRKYIDPFVDQITKLGNLSCLKHTAFDNSKSKEQSPRGEDIVNQDLQTDENITENLAKSQDTPVDHCGSSSPQNPININTVEIKKFSGKFVNGDVIYRNNNKKRPNETANSAQLPAQTNEVIVTEGQKKYHIVTPNYKSDELHRPKLRKSQLNVLEDLVYFGTSFASSNTATLEKYNGYEQDQLENKSLRQHNLLEHIYGLLKYSNTELFVQKVWTSEIDGLTEKAATLMEVLRYTLTSFHLTLKNRSLLVQNHERTPFIENIIPSLLALSKTVGFIEFRWCETRFTSNKYLDFSKSVQNTMKYNDALGYFKTYNNMEIIVVEASSGKLEENTVHTIEDCLKLLECGVSSLRKEAVLNKNSSFSTFKKLKVFGVQTVKNQVTLSELYMNNATSWNFIEKRTATIPSSWDDRIILIQYLELIATIFDDICDAQHLLKKLMEENLGLASNNGPKLKSIF